MEDPYWCVDAVTLCAFCKYCAAGFCVQLFDGVDQLLVHDVLFVVAHSASRHTLSNAFLKSIETW